MTARYVRSIDGKTQSIRRIPCRDGLFDIAHIEVARTFRADSSPQHFAALRNWQTNVHQHRLTGFYAVDGENMRPHSFRRVVDLNCCSNHLDARMEKQRTFKSLTGKDQGRSGEKQDPRR